MKIIPEPIEFQWDNANINKNYIKHEVTQKEPEEVFESEEKFIFKDEKHSQVEERYGIFGETKRKRLLSIVFTIRADNVRVITARDMSKKERRSYEEIKKNSKI